MPLTRGQVGADFMALRQQQFCVKEVKWAREECAEHETGLAALGGGFIGSVRRELLRNKKGSLQNVAGRKLSGWTVWSCQQRLHARVDAQITSDPSNEATLTRSANTYHT